MKPSKARFCKPLALLVFLSAAGCGLTVGQRAAVLKFSAATADFASVTGNEFTSTRNDVIAMNRLRVALQDPTVDPGKLDDPFTVESTQARVEAVEALKQYAELLHALATTSQEAELKTASDSFVASLRNVRGVKLDDSQAAAVGEAVQLIGGVWVERQRAEAIRRVVEVAHGHVMTLLDLVQRDFDPKADMWALGYDGAAEALRGQAGLKAKTINPNDAASLAVIAQGKTLAAENTANFAAVSQQILISTETLRKAEANLKYSLQSSAISTEDIDAYLSQVDKLVQLYRVLR
jgi:hypothetical protein